MTRTHFGNYYPMEFVVGEGKTDYEKYLNTLTLLSLQKPPAERVNPQELLFQVTHQSSELWMKVMLDELQKAAAAIAEDRLWEACRHFALIHRIQHLLTDSVDLLGQSIGVVAYGQIRTALGQGSGMESPGFNWLLETPPQVWEAFEQLLTRRNTTVRALYEDEQAHPDVFALAECLLEFDDRFHKWRTHHLDLVARTIGLESNSLKGIASKVLQRGALERFFPELLEIRSTLTNESKLAYGQPVGLGDAVE